ncbi:PfWMP4_23 [Phormidium phage Pf-WMP4]|uniref:PfWMP4_23 n=1 Tax=Phormidium phage Pf-WMP4 TaxID=2913979 RepID=Q0GBU3_9CAUD|nr:PfWMP4_23 [Phormidium phage Pf-WMP4]ABI33167.1 PfWMP4_23 [Phormidium phage Pf-WMP4]
MASTLTDSSEIYLNLAFFYWGSNRAFAGSEKTMERTTLGSLPLALDNVYADLQEQSNDTGGTVVVFCIFPDADADEKEHLKSLFPPKIILPKLSILKTL